MRVRVQIAEACPVPGVRAFLVHKKLSALGTIRVCTPPVDELKAGRVPNNEIAIELETQAAEAAVRKAIASIADVASTEVVAVVAPTSAPKPEATELKPAVAEAARTVKVRTEILDYFLDDVGELLLVTARLREIGKTLPLEAKGPFEEGVDRLHAIAKNLHDNVMSVRMTPLAMITERMPRVVRDVARARNKEVEFSVSGADIELDRAILDQLAEPLLHLLRNAIDHGIEAPADRLAAHKPRSGKVTVAARRDRDRVVLEIEDDGRGMDVSALKAAAVARGNLHLAQAELLTERDALRLAFLPGVSTARDVTEVSGRGVGMDAVARAVELVGGTVELESTPGRGTRVILRLPLTVAVINVLFVNVGREVFGLPIAKVSQIVEADPATLPSSRRSPMVEVGGTPVPARALSELLGVAPASGRGVRPFVVIDSDQGRVALQVDSLIGQDEAVLKPLSRPLDLLPGLSGVTILGTGHPVFILDVPRLL